MVSSPVAASSFFSPALRPLPGAFSRRRNLIFIDWDDTLCPTTWIRSLLKGTLAEIDQWAPPEQRRSQEAEWHTDVPKWFHHHLPDRPEIREQMNCLQEAVMSLIDVAQVFGVVCIVTNAVRGWVEKTISKWLPRLTPYIRGHGARPAIRVIYGQQAYQALKSDDNLPWFDELGEYMWWKKAAMSTAIQEIEELYRLDVESRGDDTHGLSWTSAGEAKRITNIISLGDNEAEMQAAEISAIQSGGTRWHAAREATRRPSTPRPHRVKVADVTSSVSPASHAIEIDGCRGALIEPRQIVPGNPFRVNSSDFHVPRSRGGSGVSVIALPAAQTPEKIVRTCTSAPPVFTMKAIRGAPWVKNVKLEECSHVRKLTTQLREFSELLPQLVAARGHCRIELDVRSIDGRLMSPVTPRSPWYGEMLKGQLPVACSVDQKLQRSLQVQTV
eukprot:TRINITY_DN77122_c0_g1_i1.p1 TRINITY_DN77122_c0_g1~~TRINITY_DN77122_c0_g1_i1.p1  ORF type:complete len:460 (-),score=72.02 TRINITY_DN77122_c0_g1_i1:54-1382(-)